MKIIDKELEAVKEQLDNIYIENEYLRKSLKKFLCGSSKRIRTVVTSLYLKASGFEISHDDIIIMTAGELIHNASLLHDDVLDGAVERRGKITIGKEFSSNVSILSGDFLLAYATEMLLKLNNQEILRIFLECTKNMCNSEINQFFLRGNVPELSDYIRICEGKTANLFEAIMKSCIFEKNIEASDALKFSHDFGILFQLKNDLESRSANADESNEIYTPKDFLGIEKTMDLIDNYLRRIREVVSKLPDNIYKKGLESLLSEL